MIKLVTNKGFMRIFVVLLIVFTLMFLLNYLSFKNSTELMHKQVKDNNRLVASNIIQSFDSAFQDVNHLIYSIDILPYKYTSDKQEEAYNNYETYKSLNKLLSSSSSSDYIEEIVIYNDNTDVAVTPQGTIDLNAIFNTYYINNQYNYLYWKSFFNKGLPFKVFPAMKYEQEIQGQKTRERNFITIAGKIHRSLNNMLIFIDVKKLLQSIDQYRIEDSSFAILDQNNEVLLNTEENINLVDMVNDFYVGEGKERVVNNHEYEYIIYKSDYNAFTYIHKIPYKDTSIISITNNHRLITIIGIAIAIFLTFLLTLYLFQPNIRFKNLVGGDYSWTNIYETIRHLKLEKEQYETKMDLVDSEIRKSSFLDIIHQNKIDKNQQSRITNYAKDYLVDRQFLLINFLVTSKTDQQLPQKMLVKDLKKMIQSDLSNQMEKVTVFHVKDHEILALIGIHTASDRSKVAESLEHLMKKVDRELNELLLTYHLKASISRVFDSSIENVQVAYQSIVDVPFYRNIANHRSIYDVEDVHYTTKTYFPSEKVERLSNLFMSGNGAESLVMINRIIEKNVEMNIQYYQFAAILQSIILSMKKSLTFSGENQEVMYTIERDFFNYIRGAAPVDQLEESFMKIVRFISQKVITDKESKLNRTFIAQYIELHYMEGLYLEHMAIITETSPKYFSKYFKKTFEVNFIEYLNRVRINRAKEFLKNSNDTVSEVGEKVGFIHATTFSSTFKRFTGITPSQYRNKHLGGKK